MLSRIVLFAFSVCWPLLSGNQRSVGPGDLAAIMPGELQIDSSQTAGLNIASLLSGGSDVDIDAGAADSDTENDPRVRRATQPRWWLFTADGTRFALMRRSESDMRADVDRAGGDAMAQAVDIIISPAGVDETEGERLWLVVSEGMALFWGTSGQVSQMRGETDAVAFPVQVAPAATRP